MKLAITGKGGVGKTTIASLLARIYAQEGKSVIAIDANPDANLGTAIGFSTKELRHLTPIAELKDLIEERTGATPGGFGSFFKANPKVDDIPERFGIKDFGITLLVMGTVNQGGSGCLCPESVLIKSLLSYLVLKRSEVVILDMDAGVENLGRGTAKSVDAFIIVVEPGRRSIQTAKAINKLAGDLGILKCYIVGSKCCSARDKQYILHNMKGFKSLGFVSFDPDVAKSDRLGRSVFFTAPKAALEVTKIKNKLDQLMIKG
jgi:CO dehydrogenase maturation factor